METMTVHIDLWGMLVWLVGLLLAFFGCIWAFAKVLGHQQEKLLDVLHSTSKPVSLFELSVHATVIVLYVLAVDFRPVGAAGAAAAGVTLLEEADAGLVPIALVAVTVNV